MSNDVPLGNPFNVVQYSLLTHMVAQCVGMATESFVLMLGDAHIYHDQFDGMKELFKREQVYDSDPRVVLNPQVKNIFEFTHRDIEIVGYKPNDPIHFPPAAV